MGKNGNKQFLKSDVEYVDSNGYKYSTDNVGRIENASGDLVLGQGERNAYAQRTVGGSDRLAYDDGGHLIGSQFNGSGQFDNLLPQNSKINRVGGEWYNMEKTWADALKGGSKVVVNIKPTFTLDSLRPDSFNVEYWIDGEKFIKFIKNP
ncbi:DNA/RNA non-specific endonuclease [Carnobacterium gallinarum]|nr:DNA/RNA non-specific endonuclease [Carnobacterium gallinarum]